MKTVIGLVGLSLTGKGTFIKLFRKIAETETVGHQSSSHVLAETFRPWGRVIPFTRENAQWLVEATGKQFGGGCLAEVIKDRINDDPGDYVFYDSVRLPYDVEAIKSFPRYVFVYIAADETSRLRRARERKLNSGGKVGENEITLEQLRKEDKNETEVYVPGIGLKEAAVTILNNDDNELRYSEDVKRFYKMLKGLSG